MFQTRELVDTALDARAVRVVFPVEVTELRLQLRAQASETTGPAVVTADDGRID
jgi:hypothetical protein